jgi:hypothetical protein
MNILDNAFDILLNSVIDSDKQDLLDTADKRKAVKLLLLKYKNTTMR